MIKSLDHRTFTDLDGFIKFLLAIVIIILPFYLEKQLSFGIFMVYLFIVTLASGIRYRTLLLSAASYFIIVLIPYLFGILMNALFYYLTKNEAFIIQSGAQEIFLRLFRLFIIWYVSILYFHTTPMKTILGLLDKLFFPLKLLKVPVQDYLKVVMCIVMELKGAGEEMKTRFINHARSLIGGNRNKLKSKFDGISQIIVSSLVESFRKLDEIEGLVAQISREELSDYKFKMTGREWVAVLSIFLLIAVLYY